ncbi:MAG: glycosyltransferase family 4 protein [Candidatus Levybacteria bacterium]|nr:glycosyltransferase family 4 protein [Candidatus Levybacteria bacterium]
MKKIKILVVTSSFPRSKADWWGQFILKIYEHLPKDRFAITILAPHSPGAKLKENFEDINIFRFPYFYPFSQEILTTGSGILHSKGNILAKIQVSTFLLSEFVYVIFILLTKKFDIVHSHWILPQGFFGVIAKYIFKIPLIVTIHGSDIFALKKLNLIKSFVLRKSTIVTANSTATQREAYAVSSNSNPLLIPEGVDLNVFNSKKRDLQWRKKMNNNDQIIIAVGRLIKWKGFDYLIKAMPKILKKFPKVKLVIVGSGPEEMNLKKIVEFLGLDKNVVFLKNVSHDKLSVMYASSDIFVSPSITNEASGEKEALGIVIIEAIASGIPVVASNSGGIRDTVDGKSTGFLAKEKDPDDIAQKTTDLLSNLKIRREIIKKGLRHVEKRYSWDILAKKYSDLYEKCMKLT